MIIKKKNRINYSAFTLVEMMTSIFIIVLITGIFTANYKDSNKRTDLIMTSQKMVSDIRLAQNNTMGLIRYGDNFPSGGWAVNFNVSSDENRSRYTIFADLDSPVSYEPGHQSSGDYNYRRFNEDEGIVDYGARIVDLPQGIIIDSLKTSTNFNAQEVNVNFLPPDPITSIFDGTNAASWLEVVLKDEKDGTTRTIFVNFLGLIEVAD